MSRVEIVKLNIGGTLYSTLISTLIKSVENSKPSTLEELCTHALKAHFDENNAIFIDRNPQYFSYVLDYLRSLKSSDILELPNDVDILRGTILLNLY